jgi:hypothetical protein
MAGGHPAFTTNIGYAFLLERLPGSALVECLIWHIADMGTALENVCFWGQSGHSPTAAYQTRFMSTRPSYSLDAERRFFLRLCWPGLDSLDG